MHGVDLHTHSNISDGTLSPEQLVHAAIEKGIHTLALTDHDTMDGLNALKKLHKTYPCVLFQGWKFPVNGHVPQRKKATGCILLP